MTEIGQLRTVAHAIKKLRMAQGGKSGRVVCGRMARIPALAFMRMVINSAWLVLSLAVLWGRFRPEYCNVFVAMPSLSASAGFCKIKKVQPIISIRYCRAGILPQV